MTEHLDERLSIERPVCFLCGHRLMRKNFVTIDSTAFTPLHAHQECVDALGGPREFAARAWKAIRAAILGQPETPNPAPARVQGDFQ